LLYAFNEHFYFDFDLDHMPLPSVDDVEEATVAKQLIAARLPADRFVVPIATIAY